LEELGRIGYSTPFFDYFLSQIFRKEVIFALPFLREAFLPKNLLTWGALPNFGAPFKGFLYFGNLSDCFPTPFGESSQWGITGPRNIFFPLFFPRFGDVFTLGGHLCPGIHYSV